MDRLNDARDGHGVRSAAHYAEAQAAFLAKHKPGRVPFVSDRVLEAFVSGGFWKVLCLHCGNAPIVLVDGAVAHCFGCGARFTVTFPADRDTGEALLLERPFAHRHWWPKETTAQLRADNAAHAAQGGV